MAAWNYRWLRVTLWGIAAACAFTANSAFANCSSPSAAEGSLDYNASSHYFQYCDNTSTWQPLVSGGGGGFADHIISGTTNVYVNSATSTISFTTNGSVANYFDNLGRLITTGISVTTNQLSATTGYFAGNVGIGQIYPSTTLHIYNITPTITLENIANGNGGIQFRNSNMVDIGGFFSDGPSGDTFMSAYGASNALRVQNNTGHIGIGNTNPIAKLDITGTVSASATPSSSAAAASHLRGYKADAVLIPEPEDEKLVRATTSVCSGSRSTCRGMPVHVREMGAGANAIDAAYRIIGELRCIEEEWNSAKTGRQYFEHEGHPINLNIGKIEGGDWASSVPAWCRLECRISIYPGQSADGRAREISDRIAKFARSDRFLANLPPTVTFNGFQTEGYILETGSDAEAALGDAHRVATGRELESFMTAGYLDTRVHALYDKIPALCYGPYSQNIHGFDERVSLASVKRITGTIALFIAEWCGTEPTRAT